MKYRSGQTDAAKRSDPVDELFVRAAGLELAYATIDRLRNLSDLLAQLLEHTVRVGVRLAPDLGGLPNGAFLDVARAQFGRTHEVVLADAFGGGCFRVMKDALRLGTRVGDDLVTLLGQPPAGFDLLGNGHADLIQDVEDLGLVDERARGQRQARARAKDFFELVQQIQNGHSRLHDHRAL